MRIDAYMQVSQIYQANKTQNAPKTGNCLLYTYDAADKL